VDDEDAMKTELAMMRTGGGASWSLYYDESGSTQSIASSGSLEKAMASFVQFHERQPTNSEVQQIRSFLSLKLPVHNEADYNSTKMVMARHCIGSELNVNRRYCSKVLVSPVAEKKSAKRFNVYLEDSKLSQKETEQIAVKWFERFNKRQPSEEEKEQIRSFIAKDAPSDLTEQRFLVDSINDDDDLKESDDEMMVIDSAKKCVTKKVVTKKAATGYTLNFEDDEKRDIGDEEEAMKWFKRFNHREPSNEEKQQIKQFVKGDQDGADEEMVDIE